MSSPSLPASFKSVYRLFWRLSSSSVLHKKSGRRYIRKLYRPFFEAGATVTKQLQEHPGDVALQKQREEWLKTWNKRVDGTLSLLYHASKSRGLPHRLIYNLHYFSYSARSRIREMEVKLKPWKLNASVPKERTKQAMETAKQFQQQGWNALGEVIQMAEGRDNLSLGHVKLRRPARIGYFRKTRK